MEYYIYITTNLINGKKYIGQHKGKVNDSYLGSGTTITKAINKYGKENFTKEILCMCASRKEADEKEKEYIALYNAVESEMFYNNSEGGNGGDGWRACQRYFKEHPEEAQAIYKQNGERLKQWAKDNPELFQEKVIKPMREGHKKWQEENPELVKINMEKVNKAKEEWRATHPEEYQAEVEKWRTSGTLANSKKVQCIETEEIFNSMAEGAKAKHTKQPNISRSIKQGYSAGWDENNKKLHWRLYPGDC